MLTREDRLVDLLERWEEARQQGQALTPEELCVSCPDLLADLREQIAMHQRLGRLARSEQGSLNTDGPANKLNPTLGWQPGLATPRFGDLGSVGLSIPGYSKLQPLAFGGMGQIFRARDDRLNREVALKVVRTEQLSPALLTRLVAEARAVAQLNHPGIVQVYEVGQCRVEGSEQEMPYIALEFVPGKSLQQHLADKPLPPGEAARMVQLLARAVQHAHERGIVHRDLKPDNVLLAPPGDEPALNTALGCPKITDFGLARHNTTDQRLTQAGSVMGTPAYMAPEQAEGRDDIGPAADIYSLGVIFYRLLAGKLPFSGKSAVDVLYQVQHKPPPPIQQFASQVPPELEAICLRCLAKNPAERYPSARALADALRNWLDGALTETLPRLSIARKQPTRRGWLIAASFLGLIVLGGMVAWALSGNRSQDEPETTPEQRQDAKPKPPFKGSIDLEMTRAGDRARQFVRLHDPASRPLKKDDEIRIVATLNRDAFVYVLWIDIEGKVQPVYPWIEGDWKRRRPEKPVTKLSLPDTKPGDVWIVEPGAAGMETMLLLVRETLLPKSIDLEALLKGLPKQHRSREEELGEVAWFENGQVVTDEKNRAANLKKAVGSSNPNVALQSELQKRLKDLFTFTRAVTFGNAGGK